MSEWSPLPGVPLVQASLAPHAMNMKYAWLCRENKSAGIPVIQQSPGLPAIQQSLGNSQFIARTK